MAWSLKSPEAVFASLVALFSSFSAWAEASATFFLPTPNKSVRLSQKLCSDNRHKICTLVTDHNGQARNHPGKQLHNLYPALKQLQLCKVPLHANSAGINEICDRLHSSDLTASMRSVIASHQMRTSWMIDRSNSMTSIECRLDRGTLINNTGRW